MVEMVVGFCFNFTGGQVALIRKNRPEWQKGRLNGVGGKIEDGETPRQAMVREFEEETGAPTYESDWHHFATMRSSEWVVHVFSCRGAVSLSDLRSKTDETIELVKYGELAYRADLVSNLHWLIPLALNRSGGIKFPVEIEYE